MVISGTENLKKEIKNGVNRCIKGYDELDSRFGRTYMNLLGATEADVVAIATANGLPRDRVEAVWKEAGPVQKLQGGRYISVVEDMRRLKRIVQKEVFLGN